MNKIFALICLSLFSYNMSGQSEKSKFPQLTKKQMEEELQYLIKTLKDVSPHISFKKEWTKIDPIKKAEEQIKLNLDKIENFEDYFYLVRSVLCCMQDLHCGIYDVPKEYYSFFSYINPKILEQTHKYIENFDRFMFGGFIDLKNIDGKYYTPYDFWATNNHDSLFLPAGSEIISINKMPINYYEKLNYTSTNTMRWDNKFKCYFNNTIFSLEEYGINNANLNVLAITPKQNTIVFDFFKKNITAKGIQYTDSYDFKVNFFDDEILYIRIPQMDLLNLEFMTSEIQKYRNKNIVKLIIDIRNNTGGNDKFWVELLSYIICNEININSKLIVKKTDIVIKYLKEKENIDIEKINITNLPIKINDNYKYVEIPKKQSSLKIIPNKNSLKYKGKIFILSNENTYSSALGFNSALKNNNQFVSIGQKTGRFGGRGFTPFLFYLPYSKIVFSVEPVLDLTNVSNLKEVSQDNLDIEIRLNIQDYVKEYSYNKDRYSKYFLYNYDKTFKFILTNF